MSLVKEFNKPKVAILGANGQLGQHLLSHASANGSESIYEVKGFDLPEFDLLDAALVASQLEAFKPQVVINTAAYTAVDHAEQAESLAFEVNGRAVGVLAEVCERIKARLIHVSTDYVFSGQSSVPMRLTDHTSPINVYGASKLAGEQQLMRYKDLDWTVVRTAWLYSNLGKNFLNTMLKLMAEKPQLRVVCDQVGSPTSALDMADALWHLVEQPQVSGIQHWTDAGVASWYDFAVAIQEEATAAKLLMNRALIEPVTTEHFPTPAKRPAYSVLDKSETIEILGRAPRHWRRALRAVIAERVSAQIGSVNETSH